MLTLDFPAVSQKSEVERSLVSLVEPPSHLLGQGGSSPVPAATCRVCHFTSAPAGRMAGPEGCGIQLSTSLDSCECPLPRKCLGPQDSGLSCGPAVGPGFSPKWACLKPYHQGLGPLRLNWPGLVPLHWAELSLSPLSLSVSLWVLSFYVPGFCFLIPFVPCVWSCPLCPSCLLLVVHRIS